MKFQSIFIFLIVISLIYGHPNKLSSGRLNEQENKDRLESCGSNGLDTPSKGIEGVKLDSSQNSQFWMSYTTNPKNLKETLISAAIPISSRHFLTFSNTVFTKNMEWLHNGTAFDRNCTNESKGLEIPKELVNRLNLATLNCYNSPDSTCKKISFKAVKAYLLDICYSYIKDNYEDYHAPMVIEVNDNYTGKTACLSDDTTNYRKYDPVDSYEFVLGNGPEVVHRIVNISLVSHPTIATTDFFEKSSFGGFFGKVYNGKWTIIGFSQMYTNRKQSMRFFYKAYSFKDSLCTLVGICGHVVATTIETKTTTTIFPTSSGFLTTLAPAPKSFKTTTSESPTTTTTLPTSTPNSTTHITPSTRTTIIEPTTNTTFLPTTTEILTTLAPASESTTHVLAATSESTATTTTFPTPIEDSTNSIPEFTTDSTTISVDTPFSTTSTEPSTLSAISTPKATTKKKSPQKWIEPSGKLAAPSTSTSKSSNIQNIESDYDDEEFGDFPSKEEDDDDDFFDDDHKNGVDQKILNCELIVLLIFVWFLMK